ncbi:MAG: hypothetical protein KUG77_25615 [Nannocystaceae bacterium]|nr:hypothetical protein [Nannocystaceae bacterium]
MNLAMLERTVPEPSPRPTNVPASATWEEGDNEYLVSALKDGKKHGKSTWYRPDGTRCCETLFEYGEANGPYARYHENGERSQVGTMKANKRHGLIQWYRSTEETTERTVPDACPASVRSLAAEFVDNVPYAMHFFDGDGNEVLADGTPVPERPEGVEARAVFSPAEGKWFFGLGSQSVEQRDGEWSWWSVDGTLCGQHLYEQGKQLVERKFHDNGKLFVERIKDNEGRELRTAYFYGDGDLNHSTDNTYDGDTLAAVEIHKFRYGLRAKGVLDEAGMDYTVFDQEGDVEARGHIADGHASGVWTFVDHGETYEIDLSKYELSASVDEDFQPRWLLGAALLPKEADAPIPEQLAGVQDIDWAEIPSCYGDTEEFALYLRALVSDVPAVRSCALGELESETLHQETVYVATARALPFIVRAMAHPNADVPALLQFIRDAASSAAPYRGEALEWEEDDDDRIAILGVMDATREGFEAIAAAAEGHKEDLTLEVLALAEYAGDSGTSLLRTTLDGDQPRAQAVAARALLELDSATPLDAVPLLTHPHPLVRCVAALSAAGRQDEAPEATVGVLLESLAMHDDLERDYRELPFAELPLAAFLALSLGNFRTDAARGALVDLLAKENTVGWNARPLYYRGLFALCFGQGEPPFAPDFGKVFELISEDTQLDGYVNFFEVARMWNLPTEREEYVQLLAALEQADDPDVEMVKRYFTSEENSA